MVTIQKEKEKRDSRHLVAVATTSALAQQKEHMTKTKRLENAVAKLTFLAMVRPFRLAVASTFDSGRKADATAVRKGLTKGKKNVIPKLDTQAAS